MINDILTIQHGDKTGNNISDVYDTLLKGESEMAKPSRILLIENNPDTQYVRSRLLMKDKHEVTIASALSEAVNAVKNDFFDLVIFTVDNYEVLNMSLAQFPANTAILLLADRKTADFLAENTTYGIRTYLFKPFSHTKFRKSVVQSITAARMLREGFRNDLLASLGDANRTLSHDNTVERIFEDIARIVSDGTDADNVSIIVKQGVDIPITRVEIGKFSPSWSKIASRLDVITEPVIIWDDQCIDVQLSELMHKSGLSCIIRVPLFVKGNIVGFVTAAKTRRNGQFTNSDLRLISVLAWWAGMALDNIKSYQDCNREHLHADKLLEQISLAQEKERKRVAVEIHDGVAQWLVGASYDIKLCSRLMSESNYSELGSTLENVRGVIQRSVTELRRAISNLPLPSLEELGLTGVIMKLAEKLAEDGIKCRVNIPESLPSLTSAQQKTFYWLVQESINNVRKHSEATCVDISIFQTGDSLNLQISDNGVGFIVDNVAGGESSLEHIGLLGMKERADFLKGCLRIESQPGKGTKIHFSFSLLPPELVMIARK